MLLPPSLGKSRGRHPHTLWGTLLDAATQIQICMGLSKEIAWVLHDFILETFAKFNKLDCRQEIMEEKIDILVTWFTELRLIGVQHFQIVGATDMMKQDGETPHPVRANIDARVLGHSDRGRGSQTISEIPAAIKGMMIVNEVVDTQAEAISPIGMDWLDYNWSHPYFECSINVF